MNAEDGTGQYGRLAPAAVSYQAPVAPGVQPPRQPPAPMGATPYRPPPGPAVIENPIEAEARRIAAMPDYVGYAPARPDRWQGAARTTQMDTDDAAAAREQAAQIFEAQQRAAVAQTEAAANETEARARAAEARMLQERHSAAQEQAALTAREDAVKSRMAELSAEREQVAAMPTDPNKPSKGTQFMSAIALGLGAYGSAKTGSPNYAQELIQKQIERKTAEMVRQKDAKGAALEGRRNDYAELLARGESPESARLRIRARLESAAQQETEAMLQRVAGTHLEPKLQELLAMQAQQALSTDAAYAQLQYGQMQERMVPGTPGGPVRNRAKEQAIKGFDAYRKDVLKSAQGVNSELRQGGVFDSEAALDASREISKQMAETGNREYQLPAQKNVLKRAARAATDFLLGDDTATLAFDTTEERDFARQHTAWANGILKSANGAGVMTDSDIKRLQSMVAAATTFEDRQRVEAFVGNGIAAKKRSIEAGHDPNAVNYRESRYQEAESASGINKTRFIPTTAR